MIVETYAGLCNRLRVPPPSSSPGRELGARGRGPVPEKASSREEHLLGEVPQGAVTWVRELTGVREVRRVRGMVERERGKRLMLALA